MSYVPAVILLMIVYMASLVGFTTPHQQAWYLYYTPYFILLNALLLFLYQKEWNKSVFFFIASTLILSLGIETLMTQTIPYSFGKTLGFSLLGIPLVMPIYWLVNAFSTACIIHKSPLKNQWLQIISGALLMTGLTGLIHQVAPKLDFWTIASTNGNSLFFAVVFLWSLVCQYLFARLQVSSKNSMAIYIYGGLLIFFIGVFSFL
ncbi:hypothetical protein [Aureispira sp. CCB-QB1]|uniref:hypothetical protein n=1 Tax=Aureispira sp. CCB-QB1 TaxID=1313421 RepID=UPI0006989336|nr:hypothetical protein [Aureispira sp. CCB-QB1]